MRALRYRYVVELFTRDGRSLGAAPADGVDWLPAVECACFDAIRLGTRPAQLSTPAWHCVPRWRDGHRPLVDGVAIALDDQGSDAEPYEIPLDYFQPAARQTAARYSADGRLKPGEQPRFQVAAYAYDEAPVDAARESIAWIEEVPQELALRRTTLERFRAGAVCVGQAHAEDPPVFMSDSTLTEIHAQVCSAPDVETGGILLGRLHRDTADPRTVFIEITAQVPAQHALSSSTRLTFTPQTWAAARAAVALRGAGELILGWHHSHPHFCRQCDPRHQSTCPLNRVFFSSDDCALHRTIFHRAFQVALLMSVRPEGVVPAMFGWRRGIIAHQALHVLGGRKRPARRAVTANVGGLEYVGGVDHENRTDSSGRPGAPEQH